MKVRIIAVGSKMPGWVEAGWDDYAKRLGSDLPVELVEVPVAKRSNNSNTLSLMEKEAQGILAAIKSGDRIVALDVLGKSLSTEQMAAQLANWQQDGRNTALIIGGPDGIHPDLLKKAEHKWSLSALTYPHPLVRLVLIEQLYRCWSIHHNHPYHRA